MSDAPGENTGESGQAGGNQPQGGQRAGGAPQGQPPQGAYQTGPGISDIFSRPETMKEIKVGLLVYAIISAGLGIGAFGLTTISGTGAAMMAAGFVFLLTMLSPFILGAAIAGFLGLRHASELDDEPQNLLLGTSAFTGFAGTIVMFVVGFIFSMLAASGSGSGGGGGGSGALGDMILPLLIVCVGAAIAGAGCAWVGQNILAQPPQPQPPAGAQQRQ